jgi:hypothetical protein
MFACSGPGADAAISESIRISQIHAAVLVLMLLASAGLARLNGKRAIPWILLTLLAIHPTWTVSVGGDCGSLKQHAAWLVTAVASLTMVWQVTQLLDAPTRSANSPGTPPS